MVVPPILCIVGGRHSGKTHLLERVIGRLSAAGLRVGAVKHCGHIDAGAAGRDSDRLAGAGARPAIAAAEDGVEILRAAGDPALLDMVAIHCRGCDLVLAEGYGRSVHDKVLLRYGEGRPPPAEPESVRLVLADEGAAGIGRDDTEAVADWILNWRRRRMALREGLTAAVLTGGGSRRMGTDKAALKIAGKSILARMCELLADRVGEVTVIGRRPACDDAPACAAWQADIRPGLGPLGGIATALRLGAGDGPPRGVCVAACDMPAIDGVLLDHLLAGRSVGAPATAPVHPATGRLEPMPAIYEPGARESIEHALDRGELSVTAWLTAAGAHRLAVPEKLADRLANVNTPDELDALRRRMEGGNGA